MIDEIVFFDSDCLSSFLWAHRTNILVDLFGGRMVLPRVVYDEMSSLSWMKREIDILTMNNIIEVRDICVGTKEFDTYIQLIKEPEDGFKVIGGGEAAALSFVICGQGILASNNYKDIGQYIRRYGLKNLPTSEIMYMALEKKLISEDEGNKIWKRMRSKNRILPEETFSDYLKKRNLLYV